MISAALDAGDGDAARRWVCTSCAVRRTMDTVRTEQQEEEEEEGREEKAGVGGERQRW
jgi:hypothetical protein